MTTLKADWIKEAKAWDKNGDPAYDSSKDRLVVLAEMERKRKALAQVEADAEKTFTEFFKAVFGVDPKTIGYTAAGGLSLLILIKLLVKKAGKEIAEEFYDTLGKMKMDEAVNEVLPPSQRTSPGKRRLKYAKEFGGKVLKRIGIAELIVAALTATGLLASALAYYKALKKLDEKERLLRRALRYEALQIDPATYREQGTFAPQVNAEAAGIEDKLEKGCVLLCQITERYFLYVEKNDEIVVREKDHGEKRMSERNSVWEREIEFYPIGIFGSFLVRISLFCPETKELKVLHEYEIPYRTDVPPGDAKGKLTSEHND